MVAVVMVVAMVVVVARGARVRRDGEHRQHGGDGKELGEGHGEPLSSVVNRPETRPGAASCLKTRRGGTGR
jgi:hypothetical protein